MQNCQASHSTSSLKGIPSSPTCVQGFTALSSLLSLPVFPIFVVDLKPQPSILEGVLLSGNKFIYL